MKVISTEDEPPKSITRFRDSSLLEVLEVLKDKCHLYHRDAWAELFVRFNSRILKAVKNKTYKYDYDDPDKLAEDITVQVFTTILSKISHFSFEEKVKNDIEKQEVSFFRWVFRIINSTFIDLVRTNQKTSDSIKCFNQGNEDKDYPNEVDLLIEETGKVNDEAIQKELLKEAIDSLSTEDKHIIMVYLDFGRIDGDKWILDAEHKQELMNKCGLKSNSLDQKKKRIVEKLKKKMQ